MEIRNIVIVKVYFITGFLFDKLGIVMGRSDELFVEAMKDILRKNPKITYDQISKAYIDYFYDKLVTPNDQKLLNFAFSSNVSQQELDSFLKSFDIECVGSAKSLLLSYVMKFHSELRFNEYTGPRLSGLFNFYRFNNLTLISQYTKIVKELNKRGIIPMILKGGAMKYLRPDLVRTMGDIDILVFSESDYQISKQVSLDLGYVYEDNVHSIDLHLPNNEAGVLDIHKYIDLDSKYSKDLVQLLKTRAVKKTVFGTESYIPSPEDMVFIGLTNMIKNIRYNTSIHGVLFTLFDIDYLKKSKSDFDWNVIINNIKVTKTYPQMCMAIDFANKIIPGIVPELVSNNTEIKKHIKLFFNRDFYYSKYMFDIHMECKKLKIKNAIKSFSNFGHYLKIKILKKFLNLILHHDCLIDLFLKISTKIGA